ncbi:MAG: ABC transporter permease [Peptococcaceae bacterium]|nr:ABC transporter permease [Peptococcaceae bacterium]
MHLFAQLAWQQVRGNRLRSAWTLVAIVLATAMLSCVTHFVASGQAMLTGMLGADYGDYGTAYQGILILPATFFCILIVLMAVVVISNVFRLSAQERTAEFGILKCVGATPAQIRKTMRWEAVFYSCLAIPLGLALGLALAWLGIGVCNHFLGEYNALAHIMLNQLSFDLHFIISAPALLSAALLAFVTVLVSAWLPARKAGRMTAIASVRGRHEGAKKMRPKKHHQRFDARIEKLLGAEGLLAHKRLQRDPKRFRTTVVSLAVAMVLFVFVGFLTDQFAAFEKMMAPESSYTVTADYQSNSARGEDARYRAPIDSDLGDAIATELAQYDGGTDVLGIGNEYNRYTVTVHTAALSPEIVDYYETGDARTHTFPVECIVLDSTHYRALCARAGVAEGSALLINNDRLNIKGHSTDTPFFDDIPQTLTLEADDGSKKSVAIGAVLSAKETPQALFYPHTNPVRLILPELDGIGNYIWQAAPENVSGFLEYATTVMNTHFPDQSTDNYMSHGYSSRVYESDDYVKVMNIALVAGLVFFGCFCGLLVLIGMTNVISTLQANVLMRTGEFAVLQSVGMTPEGVRKMLAFESVLCTLRAILIGVPVGWLLTYLANLPLRASFPIPYHLPWQISLICSLAVLALTLLVTALSVRRLRQQNLIETIRRSQRLY